MRDLSAVNKADMERMLLFSREPRKAYLLKENSYDSLQAKARLRVFRAHAFVADLSEFAACLTMLKNWEPYILNAFDCSYSNGFTEGVNNKIKVLKRIAFGYRSFRNFAPESSAPTTLKGAVRFRSQLPLFLLIYCSTPTIDGEPDFSRCTESQLDRISTLLA